MLRTLSENNLSDNNKNEKRTDSSHLLTPEDAHELEQICQNGGGFDLRQIQLALMQKFYAHKEIYIPSYTELSSPLPLSYLREQGYQFVFFSFPIKRHQIAACVTLDEKANKVTLYDSQSKSFNGERKNARLKKLLGEDIVITMGKSRYHPQPENDDWSCGVHVVANLATHYSAILESNENMKLNVIELAHEYFKLYVLQRQIDESNEEKSESNLDAKKIILRALTKHNNDSYQNLTQYLSRTLKGKEIIDTDKNIKEVIESSVLDQKKSILLSLEDYSAAYKNDSTGKLILQIAHLHLHLERKQFKKIINRLLALIPTKKNDNEKSHHFIIQLLDTDLELELKNKYHSENEQYIFLNELLSIILSQEEPSIIFEKSLKLIDCYHYIKPDTEPAMLALSQQDSTLKYGEENCDLNIINFELLKIVAHRAMDTSNVAKNEILRMKLEKNVIEEIRKDKVKQLKSLLERAGLYDLNADIINNLINNLSAYHFLLTYLDESFFCAFDTKFNIEFLTYLSATQKNINWPFSKRPLAYEIYPESRRLGTCIHYADDIHDASTFYSVLSWLPKSNHIEFVEFLIKNKQRQWVFYWLSCEEEGIEILENYNIRKRMRKKDLNFILPQGPDKGISVFGKLMSHKQGRALFTDDILDTEIINARGMNAIAEQGYNQGESAVYWLTYSKGGKKFLIDHPELVAMMSEQSLNALDLNGHSAVYWLTCCGELGYTLLKKYPELINKINEQGLNAADIEGDTAISWLSYEDSGRSLLKKNAELVKKINEVGFNALDNNGHSAAKWLLCTKTGRSLLKKSPALVAKISEETLNACDDLDPPLSYLTATKTGRKILYKFPDLVAKINATGLNANDGTNTSVLNYLCRKKRGIKFLYNHPELVAMISKKGLNRPDNKNGSAVTWLAHTREGIALLEKYPELVAKINHAGLNTVSLLLLDGAAITDLAKTDAGIALLDKHPELVEKITISGLNSLGKQCNTAAIYLSSSENGRALLGKHPMLVEKFTDLSIDGQLCPKNAFYHLVSSKSGRNIILKHPDLVTEVGARNLNANKCPDKSALHWLTSKKSGRTILNNHPDLVEKISTNGLNATNDDNSSPLYYLLHSKSGRKLLNKHPNLIDNIEKDCLNKIISDGRHIGSLVACSLLTKKSGRKLLAKHPHLFTKITDKSLCYIYETKPHKWNKIHNWLLSNKDGCERLHQYKSGQLLISRSNYKSTPYLPTFFSHMPPDVKRNSTQALQRNDETGVLSKMPN